VTAEQALKQAEKADSERAAGSAGPLAGIPLALKDIFCTRDVKTSCGSKMLDNFIAPYNATVVEKLNAAGTISLGKTNMDEFAMGSSNENSFYGPQRGGSSSRFSTSGHGHRYRRFYSPASGVLWHHRLKAHLWPRVTLWHHCLRFKP